ncbi:MAG: M23 family metallopeptidase [Clostridia bacterium]|nr:M23 family metallopeptidase [Clostridia bacterium]
MKDLERLVSKNEQEPEQADELDALDKNTLNKYFFKTLRVYFQIFLCVVILTFVLIVKAINPSVYSSCKEFYIKGMNTSIVENFDLQKYKSYLTEEIFHRKNFFQEKDRDLLIANTPILLTVPISKPLKDGTVTSRFGIRKDPFTLQNRNHSGLDIGANNGEIIHAILPGTVVKAEKLGSYGNCVILDHGNNIQSLYAHCDKIFVDEGSIILRGQDLALVGHSGRATGDHLHFEISVDGVKQNPEKFLENAYI